MMRLRDAITQAERNAGTGRELAKILDVTPTTICRWKRGESAPRWDLFMQLVEIAGVSAHDVALPEQVTVR